MPRRLRSSVQILLRQYRPGAVRANLRRHDPSLPFLLGGSLPGDTIHQATQTSWQDPQLRLEF